MKKMLTDKNLINKLRNLPLNELDSDMLRGIKQKCIDKHPSKL